jgi:phage terminase large subunit GpA-like protein
MPLDRVRPETWDNLLVADRVNTWDWICEHVVLREGQRVFPYNGIDYPYHRGICEASDDPRVQELVMVAGTQTGKSTLGRSWLVCRTATEPANGIFASSIQTLAKSTARDELWPMFADCGITRPWVPTAEKDRATDTMRLSQAKIRVAYSGSPTTLGDWTARWGLAGEVDKWNKEASDEADSLALFFKRFGAVNDYQWFAESTPTYQLTSRIWRLLLAGSNCRFEVPCPLCGGSQELQLGNGKGGGIVWDKPGAGEDAELVALQTARYRCGLCKKEWGDEYRMPAVRSGVWVPEGCRVDDRSGKLKGEPLRPFPRASFQISRLYSPRTTWGKLARERVQCGKDPELLRDYYNSTLGLPWEQRRKRARWNEVADRLCVEHELGICPAGSIFVTCGVDVQLAHLVYLISAWGLRATGWCIGLGTCETFADLRPILDQQFPHEDGGPTLGVEMTLVDSRYREDEVFDFCESTSAVGRFIWPYKGAKPGQLQGRPYRKIDPRDPDAQGRLKASQRVDDFFAVTGNTNWWQSWADKCLYEREPGDDSSYSFHESGIHDEDLFSQLTNEIFDGEAAPPRWVKLTESSKVDFRDTLRMSRTAAEVNLLGAWSRLVPRRLIAPGSAAARGVSPETSGGNRQQGWVRRSPRRRSRRR